MEIERLQQKKASLDADRKQLVKQARQAAVSMQDMIDGIGQLQQNSDEDELYDYTAPMDSQWDTALKNKMRRVFGIDGFRLCQQGCVGMFISTPSVC
jgi:hypothetical protein